MIMLQNADVDINELCRMRLYRGCNEFILFFWNLGVQSTHSAHLSKLDFVSFFSLDTNTCGSDSRENRQFFHSKIPFVFAHFQYTRGCEKWENMRKQQYSSWNSRHVMYLFTFLKRVRAWTSDKNQTKGISDTFHNFTNWRGNPHKITRGFFFASIYVLLLLKHIAVSLQIISSC